MLSQSSVRASFLVSVLARKGFDHCRARKKKKEQRSQKPFGIDILFELTLDFLRAGLVLIESRFNLKLQEDCSGTKTIN